MSMENENNLSLQFGSVLHHLAAYNLGTKPSDFGTYIYSNNGNLDEFRRLIQPRAVSILSVSEDGYYCSVVHSLYETDLNVYYFFRGLELTDSADLRTKISAIVEAIKRSQETKILVIDGNENMVLNFSTLLISGR